MTTSPKRLRAANARIGEAKAPGGTSARLILGAWLCPSPDRTYVGIFTVPRLDPPNRGLGLLGLARCPGATPAAPAPAAP